jgi:selenocysteine lyase/cysteine desulfurase
MSKDPAVQREEIRATVLAGSPEELARDESFWSRIREEFEVPEDFVHLEYGYYHPACRAVIEVEINAVRAAHRRGTHYKRNEMSSDREAARSDLARLAGADPEEIIITRNTTEALNIVIQGIPLARNDEVICSDQDYPSMVEAWEQRVQRTGIVVRSISLPLDPASDAEVVDRFAAAITPRTRVLFVTHLINFTGQVLPVAKLCALGRQHGLQVIVDAAHSFAQLDFSIASLDCDYLAASLHKWLAAPLGLGMLYVRRDRISALEPLFADTRLARSDIRKLEHFGNRPDSAHIGLREAIRWQEAIGAPVKSARLHFLQRRWTGVARTLPRVRMLTPSDPTRHGAIGAFSIEGMEPREVVDRLMREHGVFVNALDHPFLRGVRVTPGMPTTAEQIDRLILALRALTENV